MHTGSEELCIYPPLPQFDADWKAFVRAAVTRYPNVRAIEVWNEPNIATFWSPAADPIRYAAVLKAAYDAVRAAGSKAPVLTGGLYPANTINGNVSAKDFLGQVYATAGAGVFDGIGSHPYAHQEVYVDRMRTRLDALRAVRDQYGDSATPLWITEVGISSEATSGVGLDRQADVLADLYRSLAGTARRPLLRHPSALRRRLRLLESVRGAQSGPDAEAGLLRAGRGNRDRPAAALLIPGRRDPSLYDLPSIAFSRRKKI